jgi:hypothetical protein
VIDVAVLQGVRLKGRVSRADLATTLGEDPGELIDDLIQSGMLLDGPILRLTPEGRRSLDELLTAEREHLDQAAISSAYKAFRAVNAEFKTLVTDWQLGTASQTPTTIPITTPPCWPGSTVCTNR